MKIECPRCGGDGVLDDRGWRLVGQPFFCTQPCPECHGEKTVTVKESDPLMAEHCRTLDADHEPRQPGCQCQWEVGDSPCPVHGLDEVPDE